MSIIMLRIISLSFCCRKIAIALSLMSFFLNDRLLICYHDVRIKWLVLGFKWIAEDAVFLEAVQHNILMAALIGWV